MMSDIGGTVNKTSQIIIPKTFQRVLSRTISGPSSPQNKHSVDWGWQGFLAYGAQNAVVVVDPTTLQHAQTFCKHRSHVMKVRWRKTQHYHQLSASYSLILASSDACGTIHVWNVAQGEAIATLQDGNKPVTELDWLGNKDGCEHLLAALHPPYSLIIWDTRHSSKVWKKSYTEILFSFQFDPFHFNQMCFLCQGCILFTDDFNTTKCPSSNGKRFFITSPSSPNKSSYNSVAEEKERSGAYIRKKVKQLVAGEAKGKQDDSCQISECIQLLYHQSIHDQILLVFPREILLVDLTINQTVGIIPVDRLSSPFVQVISCWQRNVIFCLHESGSVSGHLCRPYTRNGDPAHSDSADGSGELLYERKCQSEALRLSKSNRPIGFALNPVSEKQIALILGDSRVVFKELVSTVHPTHSWAPQGVLRSASSSPFDRVPELSIKDNYFSSDCALGCALKLPPLSLAQIVKSTYEREGPSPKEHSSLRLMIMGLVPSLSPPPLVVRMCPPLTTKNLYDYNPFIAVGTNSGSIQVLNLATGVLEREFSLHTYPVKGVEWTSLSSFLSFANQPLTNSQGMVRNELTHTDIRTGHSIPLRTNETEETALEMIRISYLKQYFILIFKEDPFELWDCQTLTPLRTMSRRFPKVTAFEWSPTTHIKAKRDSFSSSSDLKQDNCEATSSMSTSLSSSSLSLQSSEENPLVKETMVFTDIEGQLYHFSVKGNVIKHVTKIPPDTQRNTITCIAFKSNEIVLSDSDGTMTIWDLKSRVFRTINTHRGAIKKTRYAPGKDNMKLLVLYNDGVDIWDIREVLLISQLKSPKDIAKILDIDWGASDSPVLATADGCLRIMDIQLKKCSSPMNEYFTKTPIISPSLMSGEAALNLRTMIVHQPWREKYSLTFSTEDGFLPSQLIDINQWISSLTPEVKEFLETCNSIAYRALMSAYLFGDRNELLFWTVATHRLSHLSRHPNAISKQDKLIDITENEKDANIQCCGNECVSLLDTSFYHLSDNYIYKNHELERLCMHESKDLLGTLRDVLGRKLAVLGERDRVVRLLLDEEPSDPQFYTDCLRACLLSATQHSTQAQSTIKLVATNLIAAGNIWEGIELLCMIGKAVDACRYLQSYGHWDDSIWLAKCVLSHKDASDIYKRWAGHLITSGYKDLGVCVYITAGVLSSALSQLSLQQYHQRAALLFDAAEQLMLPVSANSFAGDSVHSSASAPSDIFEGIFRKYVYYLFGLGNQPGVRYFCKRLGSAGEDILKELETQKT